MLLSGVFYRWYKVASFIRLLAARVFEQPFPFSVTFRAFLLRSVLLPCLFPFSVNDVHPFPFYLKLYLSLELCVCEYL